MTGLAALRPPPAPGSGAEEEFYSAYAWCANPILTLRELLAHLEEELDRSSHLSLPWQREESLLNVYLFTCAASCTIDDALASSTALRGLVLDRRLLAWRSGWTRCVDTVCRELVEHTMRLDANAEVVGPSPGLARSIRPFLRAALPPRILQRRMRLPEAFRCQDLNSRDVLSLARRFASSQGSRYLPTAVVGVRTAGAYFAPLVVAFLRKAGWPSVTWFTTRPKDPIPRSERRRLRALRTTRGRVVVVDDHPNTGETLRLAVARLERFGVRPERITILVPRHPADLGGALSGTSDVPEGASVVTLEPNERDYEMRLDPASMGPLLREYFSEEASVELVGNADVEDVNARLSRHARDGFEVRLKRVFDVRLGGDQPGSSTTRVIAKSVGCGWLGYHAYLSGRRLDGWVAPMIGLRHGLMISQWSGRPRAALFRESRSKSISALSSYVATRVRRLPLPEDPCFHSPGYRVTGWDEVVDILRGAYGPRLGRWKRRAIRRRLRACVCPCPTLIDGRMRPDEWVDGGGGLVKVDFEQHNFGGTELDLVDPAWDLADAAFEFRLSQREERELVQTYVSESGDTAIGNRMLLYQLVHGVVTMKRALATIGLDGPREQTLEAHRRRLAARDALVYRMNRFCGALLSRRVTARWSPRLVLLELEGVFDRELLGFPHTTPAGLAALELLHAHGVSVVLNTGRGVDHVRDYCRSFGLPGGLAEHGSVFLDAVNRRETSLIDPRAAAQLVLFRDAIATLPGTFVDRGYRYSVRAFRYEGTRTTCVPRADVEEILDRCGGDALTVHGGTEFTHVAAAGTGKGPGTLALRRLLDHPFEPWAAIGGSAEDREMLLAARTAYAPANGSKPLRDLARTGRVRLTPQAYQSGLLAAAQELLSDRSMDGDRIAGRPHTDGAAGRLVLDLLTAADRPRSRRMLAALGPWGL